MLAWLNNASSVSECGKQSYKKHWRIHDLLSKVNYTVYKSFDPVFLYIKEDQSMAQAPNSGHITLGIFALLQICSAGFMFKNKVFAYAFLFIDQLLHHC